MTNHYPESTDQSSMRASQNESPDMPRRFSVTLPDDIAAKLERWSTARGQAFASVAAIALERAVLLAESEGEIPAPSTSSDKSEESSGKDGVKD